MRQIVLGVDGMKLKDLAAIAWHGAKVRLAKESEKRIVKSRALIDKWIREGKIIYGVTTGFGALSDVKIGTQAAGLLQRNILLSHSAGVGGELDADAVRAMMALRIKDLARGHSGIRLITVQRLIRLLNLRGRTSSSRKRVRGRKRRSGAPGAYVPPFDWLRVKPSIQGRGCPGAEALSEVRHGANSARSRRRLALVNGTQMSTALGGLAAYEAMELCKLADIAAAMSLEVLMGSRVEFDPRIHEVRPHPGQAAAAHNMRRIIAGLRYSIFTQRLRPQSRTPTL